MCKQHKSVIDYLTSKQGVFATQIQSASIINGHGILAHHDGGSPSKKSVHFDSTSENEKPSSQNSTKHQHNHHHHRKHKRKHSTEPKTTKSTNQATSTDVEDEEHEVFVKLKQSIDKTSIHDKKIVNSNDDTESGSETEDGLEVSIESYNGEKYFRTFGALIPAGYVLK